MLKKLLSCLLAIVVITAKAQITNSLGIDPHSIRNYDGSYDDFGQGHLFYPNGGEARFASDQSNAIDVVKYYTMNTYPQKFLLNNNNISLCFAKPKTGATGNDSLQRVDFEWQRSKSGAVLARVDTQNTAVLHYFTQWFSASGRTDVHGGAAIACQSIYNNIDLVYTSNNRGLVMYFIVYPGGNYSDIIMHIKGSTANSIVSNKLKLDVNWESMTLEKPQMYQYTISGGVVTPVTVCNASWQSIGSDIYQISTSSSYNTSLPLIIQLKQGNAAQAATTTGLIWSTYFGGSQSEFLNKTHCDANDNLYIAGYSSSSNITFPQGPGVTSNANSNGDGAIVKFSPTGVLLWSLFVGGSSTDEIHDFDFKGDTLYCVGKTGNGATNMTTVSKTGATNNTSFSGGNWDGFIFQFSFNSTSGLIVPKWRTFFGGNGDEELNACKFDSLGNFFVAGESSSTNMTPTGPLGSYQENFNSAQLSGLTPLSPDGIIASFNPGCSQTWLTLYGTDTLGVNSNTYAADYLYGIDISGSDVYVCGKAGGSNLPAATNSKFTANSFDGILAHFSTAGALNNAKFTEGNYANYAVKALWGDVYTVGETRTSAMNAIDAGIYYYNGSFAGGTKDGCFSVHDLNLSGTTIHSSFLGGSTDDAAYDIQPTVNNLFLISGGTNSADFPTYALSGMYPGSGPGYNDNFISCLMKGSANLIWSAFLGDSLFNESLQFPEGLDFQYPQAISTMALNSQGYVYVLGETNGYTNFPLDPWLGSPTYYQPQKNSFTANDATITRFDVVGINPTVGIKDFKNTQFVFGIYPNPTASSISITHSALVNEDLRYAVYDMSGKKLKTGNLKASDAKNVDVSFLPQGVYIINVSNGKMTFNNKFIKVEN